MGQDHASLPAGRHVVQIYQDPVEVHLAVAEWATASLAGGRGAILIGSQANLPAILHRMDAAGLPTAAARAEGRLAVVAADEMMGRFLRDGMPDAEAFAREADALVTSLREAAPIPGPVHAWGEMVHLLRSRGRPDAAQTLEALWNEAIARHDLRLLCSYGVGGDEPEETLVQMCRGHTHLVPPSAQAPHARGAMDAMRRVAFQTRVNGLV